MSYGRFLGDKAMFNFNEYLKKAEAGDNKAMLVIAKYYEENDIFDDDDRDSSYWYEKAAKSGNVKAQMYLAKSCYKGSIILVPDAIYWYKKAAEHGKKKALSKLARLNYRWSYRYNEDDMLYEDFDMQSCYKAAVQGYNKAQYDMASRYEHGDEIDEDIYKALFWYEESGKNGYIDAWLKAVEIYREMDDYSFEYAEEIESCYFGMLACTNVDDYKGDIEEIREYLADYYENIDEEESAEDYRGMGNFKADKDKAVRVKKINNDYYKKQYADAITRYEKMEESELLHFVYKLKPLAEQGLSEAQYYLAKAEESRGNLSEAFFWYSRAAERAYTKAFAKVAYFYEQGIVIEKSLEEAEYYLKLASHS